MMTQQAQRLQAAQYRLAQHYLEKLHTAQRAYQQGNENAIHALAMFDREREQVKQWQAWATAHAEQDEKAAAFCSTYAGASPDIFRLRLLPQEYLSWLESAVIAARQLGDRRAEAAHFLALSEADGRFGELHQMLDYAQQALDIAHQIDEQPLVALGLNLCGLAYRMLGNFEASQTSYEQSLVLYRTIGDQRGIADGLGNLGTLALQRWNNTAAQDYLEQSLVLYRVIGNQQGIAMCLNDLGFLAIRLEHYTAAQDYLEQILAFYRVIGDKQGIATALNNLASIAYLQGDFSHARDYFEQSLAITSAIGDRVVQGGNLCALGLVTMDQGEVSTARDFFEQSLAIGHSIEQKPLMFVSLSKLAVIYQLLHQEDLAYAALREALEVASSLSANFPQFKFMILVGATRVWVLRGRPIQAATWLGLVENHPHSTIKMSDIQRDVQVARAECAAAISPEQFAAAWEQGKTLDLDIVVAEILSDL